MEFSLTSPCVFVSRYLIKSRDKSKLTSQYFPNSDMHPTPPSPSSKALISDFSGCCNTDAREAYYCKILQGSTKQNTQENVYEIFEDRVYEHLRTLGLGS